jgi:hypothetical protein
MRFIGRGYALAFTWGPPVTLDIVTSTHSRPVTVKFETESQAKSSFDAEIEYWDFSLYKLDTVVATGGEAEFTFTPNCICYPRIRFKSHSVAQMIRVYVMETRR